MPRGRPSRATVYARLDEAIKDLHERFGGLPTPVESVGIWDELWHQEAHHSTALEGNTLVLRQVRLLLDEGRAVGSGELREYTEVTGYADAARWVYGQALEPGDWSTGDLVCLQEVRSIHHRVMSPVWSVAPHPQAEDGESPGSFRRHDIRPFAQGTTPPPWPEVPSRMRDWVDLVNTTRDLNDRPFPEILAEIHNLFEQIHPFLDGNGRTGRLLLNLVLVRRGCPPAIIHKNQRLAHLAAMHKADNGDHGPLGELIARAVTDNLNRFVVPAVAGPSQLVPLASLVGSASGISANALRVAALRGRLRARRAPNGSWLSSRQWVEEYLDSRQKHT
ncbi:MAG: hypothetical protein QG608_1048 [Actinomycetota bacterium]|nr:hypothetical protein [Actinomycetota bacterium]